jgi:hypothetical protein
MGCKVILRQSFNLVVAVLILGCGGTGGSGSAATPSTSPSASTTSGPSPSASTTSESSAQGPVAFRSERYGYVVELPPGWFVRSEGPGKWTTRDISYFGAGTDSFEEDYGGRGDTLDFPRITYGLYVSAAELDATADVETWTDKLAATMHSESSCQGAPERETMTVAGESAEALVYERTDCTHDHHVIVVGVLHGSVGYNLMWLAKRGEDDDRRDTFESILKTFRWVQS